MATTTLTISELVEEVFSILYRHTERPKVGHVGAQALETLVDTALDVVVPADVAVTQLLEFAAGEQVLVTAKDDGTDQLTVSRGYNATTPATHATGASFVIDPQWGYEEVDRWVRRFYDTAGNIYLPMVETAVMMRDAGDQLVTLPAEVVDVVALRNQATSGRPVDITGWQHEKWLPTSLYATGQGLRVPASIADDDELWVTYTTKYDTSGATIEVPSGAEDLAVLWASAYAVARREVSRVDLDTVEEWNQAAAIRGGQNLRLIRELWGEFYRRLDEARKLHEVPRHRPFRKMAKVR